MEQVGDGANGPGEPKGLQPPQLGRTTVVDHLLVVTVGPLAGGPRRVEDLPGLRFPLNGANKAWVLGERHPVRIAADLLAMRTPHPFLWGTRQAADILAAVGLVIVPVGAAQPSTGRIGGAGG